MDTSDQQGASRAAAEARKLHAADRARQVAQHRVATAARKQQAEIRKQQDELRKVQSVLKKSEETLRRSARAGAASVITGRYAGRLPSSLHRVANRNTVSTSAAIRAASEQVAKELRRSMEAVRSTHRHPRDAK